MKIKNAFFSDMGGKKQGLLVQAHWFNLMAAYVQSVHRSLVVGFGTVCLLHTAQTCANSLTRELAAAIPIHNNSHLRCYVGNQFPIKFDWAKCSFSLETDMLQIPTNKTSENHGTLCKRSSHSDGSYGCQIWPVQSSEAEKYDGQQVPLKR